MTSLKLCIVIFLMPIYFQYALARGDEPMKLLSSAFEHNQPIPKKFTCDGQDISPELHWTDMPAGTKSFVLIVDDPDAPKKTWVHWIVFNIPSTINQLSEQMNIASIAGAKQGRNDFGKLNFGGPCPPSGMHRYFFKLYALDRMLDVKDGATKAEIETAMEGHILVQAELVGTYQK